MSKITTREAVLHIENIMFAGWTDEVTEETVSSSTPKEWYSRLIKCFDAPNGVKVDANFDGLCVTSMNYMRHLSRRFDRKDEEIVELKLTILGLQHDLAKKEQV